MLYKKNLTYLVKNPQLLGNGTCSIPLGSVLFCGQTFVRVEVYLSLFLLGCRWFWRLTCRMVDLIWFLVVSTNLATAWILKENLEPKEERNILSFVPNQGDSNWILSQSTVFFLYQIQFINKFNDSKQWYITYILYTNLFTIPQNIILLKH